MDNNSMPRRARLDLYTPAETAIYNAMVELEKTGADERLTRASLLLLEARNLVSDYMDEQIQNSKP